ncbi:hypothetical protein PGB90_005495 [Kerria lacca]
MSCPPNCVCKWKGGKQTVECVNKSMITVPEGVDSGTQVLDFSGNNLKTLGSDQFQKLGLSNLQKIFVSRCRLIDLHDSAFKGLTNLVELDLSNNILSTVPQEIFHDLPSLMKLNLNGNPFKIIKSYTFKNLKYLISLELSRCELEVIEKDAFYGLIGLELLKLDFNLLKYIPGVNTIPKKLHGINLQHNPWFCDCNLADLFSWLNVSNVPQSIEPICDGPVRLRGAPIKLLDEQELACLPDVSPTSLYLEIAEGKNVSLLCRVNAIPPAKVSWRFEDRVLQNDSLIAPGVHLYYFVEDGTTEKKSELFIFNTNTEDNGTFICMAENQAGKAQSNYTIRIVLTEEPIIKTKKITLEYAIGICILLGIVLVLMITCVVTYIMRYRMKKKRRKKKEKSKELALYSEGNLHASPIMRSGETLSTISERSIPKTNGGIFITDQSILKMSNVATGNSSCLPHVFYSCDSFTTEQNPDLISDTGKDRKLQNKVECTSIKIGDDKFGIRSKESCTEKRAYNSTMAQCPEDAKKWTSNDTNQTSTGNVMNVPVNVCFNHIQTGDVHPIPDKFIVEGYPTDYGLPKMPTHFPPVLPATAFYRTLPHRRHNTSTCNNSRYVRDAEFLTRSMQPASYEHFLSGDVRYNVEGYPKDSPSYTYTPHVSFSDTVQILGKSCDSLVESTITHAANGCKKEYHIGISLTNASAQTQTEDLQLCDAQQNKKPVVTNETVSEIKMVKTPRLSVCIKNITDSPDEGYVGECPDTTEV